MGYGESGPGVESAERVGCCRVVPDSSVERAFRIIYTLFIARKRTDTQHNPFFLILSCVK